MILKRRPAPEKCLGGCKPCIHAGSNHAVRGMGQKMIVVRGSKRLPVAPVLNPIENFLAHLTAERKSQPIRPVWTRNYSPLHNY